MRSESGPVAVIAGTRVTMPYANAVLGHAMLEECFAHEHATLGELVLCAKRSVAEGSDSACSRESTVRRFIPARASRGNPPRPAIDGQFRQPTDVTWDPQGNIYISDGYINARVAKYDANGDWVKSFGTPGNGNIPHFTGILFARAAGIDLENVPYKGSQPAIADAMGGQVAAVVTTTARPFLLSSKARALAQMSSLTPSDGFLREA